MKIKAIVIAPYPGLSELTLSLQNELQEFEIVVEHGDLSRVLPLIGRIHSEGYDIIISRGGTAKLLQKHSYLPVVEIPVSGFDILRILTLVQGYNAKCEMIGFPNIIEGFMSVSSLMEVDISYTVIHQEQEVSAALADAKARGIQVIIGDSITVKIAAESGLQGVLITSGRESLMEAFSRAGQLYKSARKLKVKNEMYEAMLGKLEDGYAAVDQGGKLEFANPSFKQLLRLPETADTLNTMYPGLREMLRDAGRGADFDTVTSVYEPEQGLYLQAQMLPAADERLLYMLHSSEEEPERSGLAASYLLTAAPFFSHREDGGLETDFQAYPAAVYGEKGSGRKRYVINAALSESRDGILYLNIRRSSEEVLKAMMELMLYGGGRVTAIEGAELLSAKQQRELAEFIIKRKMKTVFLFDRDPEVLAAEDRLAGKLLRSLQDRRIPLPALQDTPWLERSIRACLIWTNERQGKQIAGIRSEVMEALLAHPWQGNFTELRTVMDLFVAASAGPFIEPEALVLLEEGSRKARSGLTPVPGREELNLYQPLEDIERDIIQTVLEQENMNQSLAAKRLGINRSTLWRKLKED
ncbi:PrpR N-terminal domain-containing protein [Paenibacillus sp. FSL P4-0081]|uniref:PrpR N-terminal domain-containing protein n=1 Tax=Paenibacillus sp. FSL P4-0081 TaxID=1536769 RepID=UPI0018CDEB9B|nr:PrpR N-terminal domain-containing protein [Paenibacillus sp. FSL P4-0081]